MPTISTISEKLWVRSDLICSGSATGPGWRWLTCSGTAIAPAAWFYKGVDGPGQVAKLPAPIARKLRRVGELLKQDHGWHGPTDLLAAASAARERLARNPAPVNIADPKTGQHLHVLIGRDGFDAVAGLHLNDARLPAMLVSAAAGDDRILARLAEAVWNNFAGGTVGLMGRAVDCAADRPDSRWKAIRTESLTAPFGTPIDNAVLTGDFCRAVGYDSPPVEFAGPVSSSAPALLLTGTLDATTPVENARDVARGLPNALLLDVENAAHEALPVPAVQDVVVDFLRGIDVRGRRPADTPPHFPPVEKALERGSERPR